MSYLLNFCLWNKITAHSINDPWEIKDEALIKPDYHTRAINSRSWLVALEFMLKNISMHFLCGNLKAKTLIFKIVAAVIDTVNALITI